jgi:hypothetical protein
MLIIVDPQLLDLPKLQNGSKISCITYSENTIVLSFGLQMYKKNVRLSLVFMKISITLSSKKFIIVGPLLLTLSIKIVRKRIMVT